MAPATGTALLILVAFVLPGFVTLLISERTHAVRDTSSPFERLLLALYYSLLTYVLLALIGWASGLTRGRIIRGYHHEQSVGKLLGLGFLTILVIPSFIATVSRLWLSSGLRTWLIETLRINPSHRTPTAWDHFFEQGSEAFVRATLTDGRVVGGYYGPGSFATYGEQARDLFISVQWELDDDAWFTKPAQASLGLWLAKESVVSLELYAVQRDGKEADAETH
ncbi:MAG: hypothetical protein KGL16_06860 [Acidobacteriota bacterium]|nr:hypothetical protein [Acidobacteriota bacterium]